MIGREPGELVLAQLLYQVKTMRGLREAPRLTFPYLPSNMSSYPRFLPCGVAILTAILEVLVGPLVRGSPS